MAEFERTRIVRALRQNQAILDGLVGDLGQPEAAAATDGPDGWSVVEIVCHLRDLEEIFAGRVALALAEERPAFTPLDVDALARERDYAGQDLGTVHDDLRARRRAFIGTLEGLSEDQWGRVGVHARFGEQTVERMAFQAALHDIDHLDQITRSLGRAERFG